MIKRECITCKHIGVSFFRYPCKECYEYKFWEPKEEKEETHQKGIVCGSSEYSRLKGLEAIKGIEDGLSGDTVYKPSHYAKESGGEPKEEKECKDCRHRGIGCECSEPCKNHDRWQPKDEKEKISMGDICRIYTSEKEMHEAVEYFKKKGHIMVDAIVDALSELTFENNPGAAASDCVKEFDTVHKPSHYAKGRRFEPKDVIADWELGFNLGNAVKYISRCGRKGDPIEDLQKAKEFIDFEIGEYKKSRDKKEFENFVKTHKDEIKEALKKMEDDLK